MACKPTTAVDVTNALTSTGKKNHYNIKFLRGYGHSISVKNSKLILKDCHDPFSPPCIEEWSPNRMPYEKIILSGKGYVSTEALAMLSENNRNVILLDTQGNPQCVMSGMMSSLTATNNRIAQYDTFRIPEKRDYLSKQIVKSKIDSQIQFLKSTENDVVIPSIEKLEKHLNNLEDNILHSEAVTSRIYFGAFTKLIDERFEFSKRNSFRIQKNNATDVINALLNYGYSVLAGEISKFINGIGLDPYYGFYHKNHTSFQSLVYDMMEPFRWLVECAVWQISNAKSKFRISKKQYTHTRQGTIVLEYDLIKSFLELLERVFQKQRRYDYRHGQKTKDGLKSVHEITIAKISVQNLVDYNLGTMPQWIFN
ncbi:MAG: CRISPR-associated endonuclease Cas1 [Candidatus Nitrosopumilus sp. bin_7KS]